MACLTWTLVPKQVGTDDTPSFGGEKKWKGSEDALVSALTLAPEISEPTGMSPPPTMWSHHGKVNKHYET